MAVATAIAGPVLRALLHGKLGGFGLDSGPPHDDATDDGEPADDADTSRDDDVADENVGAIGRDEDSLTATVFGRLAYLPASVVWAILDEAIQVRRGEAPPRFSAGLPPTFWQRFPAHSLDVGRRYVEPDLVVREGDSALVVEVKWQGTHTAEQCLRELRAVSAKWAGVRLWLVVVGKKLRDARDADEMAGQIWNGCEHLGCVAGISSLDWDDRASVVRGRRRRGGTEPHVERLVLDLDEALRWRGLREVAEFQSLQRCPLRSESFATLSPTDSVDTLPVLPRASIKSASHTILSTW